MRSNSSGFFTARPIENSEEKGRREDERRRGREGRGEERI
jgi:hypothetical protein